MAGVSFTGGSKRRWSSFAGAPRRGTSLRPGGSAYGGGEAVEGPRTDGWEDYAQGAQRAANEAMANSAPSGDQGPDVANNPYLPPEDQPDKLGGGSMGLKPDMTEVRRLEKLYDQTLEKDSSGFSAVLGGFAGIPQMREAKYRAMQQRIAMARNKAYEDAMAARADYEASQPERFEPVKDAVLPGGQMLERGARSGEVRPAYVKTRQEEIDWPDFMGAAPTKVTTEVPRMADRFEEAYLKDRLGRAEEIRKNTARDTEIGKLTEKEKTLITEREGSEKRIASHRAGLEKDIATHQANLPARSGGTAGTGGTIDPIALRKLAADEAKEMAGYEWDKMRPEDKLKAIDDRYVALAGGRRIRGEQPQPGARPAAGYDNSDYGGEVGPAPKGEKIASPAAGAKRGPKVGDVVDGYEFTNATGDGNPKNPKNWKQAGRGR